MRTQGSLRRWHVLFLPLLTFVLLVVVLGVFANSSFASGEAWLEIDTPSRLPPKAGASAIYDSHHQRMIVFGGIASDGKPQSDVWSLDLTPLSEDWGPLATTGGRPSPRTQHTAVYDEVNQRMVVFGGRDSRDTLRNDVWALELTGEVPEWVLLSGGGSLSPREEHTAIYDRANQRMIVFGGLDAGGSVNNDVWAFDLTRGNEGWSRLTGLGAGPPQRRSHTAIYDAFNQRMIVFAGVLSDDSPARDVWALDLRRGEEHWTKIETTGDFPPNCIEMVAIYDPLNQRMIVYGGRDSGGSVIGQTWFLDLETGQARWSVPADAALAAPRRDHAAIYDPRDHRLVAAGGVDSSGDERSDVRVLNLTIDAPPSIRILSPENGATIDSSSVEVRVAIENFILDPYRIDVGPDREDFGHWHLLLDGEYQTFVLGTGGIEATLTGLTPGQHTIKVELANNQHSLVGVEDEVTITIPPQRPSIQILSPEDGLTTFDRDITLNVAVENIELVDPVGQPPQPGQGHYHIRVDGQDLGVFVSETSYTIHNLAAGEHRITVELQNNNHLPFNPPVLDTVVIRILSPQIRILSPQDGALINSSSVEVRVEIQDFTLDPDHVGGANEPGFGHWHLYLDGIYQGFVTGTEGFDATLTELEPGPHEIRVELANNDHSPLPFAEASDVVNITIAEGRPAIRIIQPEIPTREVPPWGRKIVVIDRDTLEVVIAVQNFILDPEGMDGPAVPGHGHWHLFVDGEFQVQTAAPSAIATGLTPGYHRVVVLLTNNDHTDLDPPVIDTFEVLNPIRVYLPLIGP